MSRKALLSGAALQPFEEKVEFFVGRMEVIRAGMAIARDMGSDSYNDDLHTMEMGLRCLWGLCAGAMAYEENCEGFEAWDPRSNRMWCRYSRYMGEAIELAHRYMDKITPVLYQDYKVEKAVAAEFKRRHDERQTMPRED